MREFHRNYIFFSRSETLDPMFCCAPLTRSKDISMLAVASKPPVRSIKSRRQSTDVINLTSSYTIPLLLHRRVQVDASLRLAVKVKNK